MNNFYRYNNYRSNNIAPNCKQAPLPPPPPPKPCPPPPPKKCKPNSPKKKKFDFKCFKKDTCKSLNDVEHFLCDFSTFVKYIKLYNLLKK